MKKSRIIWIILAVVAIAAVVAVSLKGRRQEGTAVRIEKIERKDLVSLVTASGTIEAKSKVDVSANIMGQITRLNVREGDEVKQGDLLMIIDQAPFQASVASRRASLQGLEAELARVREAAAQAQRDLDRTRSQYDKGIISKAEFDRASSLYTQAKSTVERAQRQVEQARADLASAHDSLSKTEIRSPLSGVVTRLAVEQGEVVVTGTMNNPGTVLMTISDMSTVEAVLEVDQTDVPRLALGQPSTVAIDAFPDQTFPAKVSEIGQSPITGQSALGGAATGTDYEVRVVLARHPAGIRPGLTVTADIVTSTRKNIVTVPLGAVVVRERPTPTPAPGVTPTPEPVAEAEQQAEIAAVSPLEQRDQEGVYVVKDDDTVEFRPITTGISGEMEVEVTEGLEAGERLVVGPFRALRELKPGAKVHASQGPGAGEGARD